MIRIRADSGYRGNKTVVVENVPDKSLRDVLPRNVERDNSSQCSIEIVDV